MTLLRFAMEFGKKNLFALSWGLSVLTMACATTAQSESAQRRASEPASLCPKSITGFPLLGGKRGVSGCPGDIHVRPGTFEGYEVSFGCPNYENSDSVILVRGLGKKGFRQLRTTSPTGEEIEEKEFWRHTGSGIRKIAEVSSIHRDSKAHACRGTGWAIELQIHDFRDVDQVVRSLGLWLARMDLGGEIILLLEPLPQPANPM
jgi:hypothetical protein